MTWYASITGLAIASALIPSNGPARIAPSSVRASATASATILPAARIEWSRATATSPERSPQIWQSPKFVSSTGPNGEIRYDFEFQ
jgi:hypothetical protein